MNFSLLKKLFQSGPLSFQGIPPVFKENSGSVNDPTAALRSGRMLILFPLLSKYKLLEWDCQCLELVHSMSDTCFSDLPAPAFSQVRKIRSFLFSLLNYYLTAVRKTTDLERFLQDGEILIGREKWIICFLIVNDGTLFCERLMKITCENKSIFVGRECYF